MVSYVEMSAEFHRLYPDYLRPAREARIDACKGCPHVTDYSRPLLGKCISRNVLPRVSAGVFDFDDSNFVRDCPNEVNPEITGKERFEACQDRWDETLQAALNLAKLKKEIFGVNAVQDTRPLAQRIGETAHQFLFKA